MLETADNVSMGYSSTLTPAASMASITLLESMTLCLLNGVSGDCSGNSTASAAREACHIVIAQPFAQDIRSSSCSGALQNASNSALIFSSIPTSLPAPAGHVVDSGAGDLQIERPLDLCCREPGLQQGDDHGPLQIAGLGIVVRLSVEPAIQTQGSTAAGDCLHTAAGQLAGDLPGGNHAGQVPDHLILAISPAAHCGLHHPHASTPSAIESG